MQNSDIILSSLPILSVPLSPVDLQLDLTLSSGQVFRWISEENSEWSCAVLAPENAFVRIRQTEAALEWQSPDSSIDRDRISALFRLDIPLAAVLSKWEGGPDSEMRAAIGRFRGLRVMSQDPFECLISFLASPAAPISRIRKNLLALCETAAAQVWKCDSGQTYHAFPTCEALCSLSRREYDLLGFGFRGKNIGSVAAAVRSKGGEEWVRSLNRLNYPDAKRALCELPGVGPKIADCVCLFSLGFDEAVPIDVHMARIASRLFPGDAPKSLYGPGYEKTAELFRSRHGVLAGWAQQYLYCQAITK